MVRTLHVGCLNLKKCYSVDLMFLWANRKKPRSYTVPVASLVKKNIYVPCWRTEKGNVITVADFIKNPKKYPSDYYRTKRAELKYPIFVYKGQILDGMHRLAKCILALVPEIKIYKLDEIIDKFYIGDSEYYKNFDSKMRTTLIREGFKGDVDRNVLNNYLEHLYKLRFKHI